MANLGLILIAFAVVVVSILWRVLVFLAWRPYQITKKFRQQGVGGPEYKFWSGSTEEIKSIEKAAKDITVDINSYNLMHKIQPVYTKWISQYGSNFLYWLDSKPRLCITDAELVKQVLSNKFGFYTKCKPNSTFLAMIGAKGLVFTDGSEWARHRRVVSPAFTMDKLKVMTKKMAECTLSMLDNWHCQAIQTESQALEVTKQFEELTADVISHSAFGSSYKNGKNVFLTQKDLQKLVLSTSLGTDFPGYDYLPTKRNLEKWKLERRVRNTLTSMIQNRLDSRNAGNDLLGLMIESIKKEDGMRMDMDEIIDECKTFYFAGHETTSHLLTWSIFLLSRNQEWQEKLREEVMGECGMEIPNADNLSKFKLVGMVLLEALRLYGPVVLMAREAAQDMTLGSLMVPKGTTIMLPVAIIHRNKELWGDDANEFNPLRFENGITKAAKHPNALLAFSIGPRACVGQNFAMLEAKTVLAMILQRFSFSLSPEYKHEPAILLTLQPLHGLPIVLRPLVN